MPTQVQARLREMQSRSNETAEALLRDRGHALRKACRHHRSQNQRCAQRPSQRPDRLLYRRKPLCSELLSHCRQCDLAYLNTPFTSLIEITGNSRKKIRNAVKNNPKLPTSSPTSVIVGVYMAQLEGRKSRCSDVTMITNRSNHIPTLIRIDNTKIAGMEVRNLLNQNSCDIRALQPNMIQ